MVWAQELAASLERELERRYLVYEQDIAKLRHEMLQYTEALELLEYERTETDSLVPRLQQMDGLVQQSGTRMSQEQDQQAKGESLEEQIAQISAEIEAVRSQNDALRGELSERLVWKRDSSETSRFASVEQRQSKESAGEERKHRQELEDAEIRLAEAVRQLEVAESQRKQFYDKLESCKVKDEHGDRETVSSRLEHSLPLSPSRNLVETQMCEFLDRQNIGLALMTREVQLKHQDFDAMRERWDREMTRYTGEWEGQERWSGNSASSTTGPLHVEFLQTVNTQLEELLDRMIASEEETATAYKKSISEMQELLEFCSPCLQGATASHASASEFANTNGDCSAEAASEGFGAP